MDERENDEPWNNFGVLELVRRLQNGIVEQVIRDLVLAEEEEELDGIMEIDVEVIHQEPVQNRINSLYQYALDAITKSNSDKILYSKKCIQILDSTPNKLLLDLLVCAKDNVPISKDYPVEPEDEFDKQNIDNKVAYFVTLATSVFYNQNQFGALLSHNERFDLHSVFQQLFNCLLSGSKTRLDEEIADFYIEKSTFEESQFKFLESLAEFLREAGWFSATFKIHNFIVTSVQKAKSCMPSPAKMIEFTNTQFHSNSRRIFCSIMNGNLKMGKEYFNFNEEHLVKSPIKSDYICEYYSTKSLYAYALGDYETALRHANEAFKQVKHGCSINNLMEVLRCLSRALAVRRHFNVAIAFSTYLLDIASQFDHKMAEGFANHAYCLMQSDKNFQASLLYRTVLHLREKQFGYVNNIHLAIACEEMSYACYVLNYQSGKFLEAKRFIQKSKNILKTLLPPDHLLLSSSKRVEALILEEIALEKFSESKEAKESLLEEAHQLQQESLKIAILTYGEDSLQTAKHYGNLGRLYQSMEKYKEAEKLHLKAIQIKESLLGLEDPEVALSLGHLASLYNYDMMKFKKAETMYKRCINICLKLFGSSYSGLEYDYRGLIRIYQHFHDLDNQNEFESKLYDWKLEREEMGAKECENFISNPNHHSYTSLETLLDDIKLV